MLAPALEPETILVSILAGTRLATLPTGADSAQRGEGNAEPPGEPRQGRGRALHRCRERPGGEGRGRAADARRSARSNGSTTKACSRSPAPSPPPPPPSSTASSTRSPRPGRSWACPADQAARLAAAMAEGAERPRGPVGRDSRRAGPPGRQPRRHDRGRAEGARLRGRAEGARRLRPSKASRRRGQEMAAGSA